MPSRTITRSDLYDAVYHRVGISRGEAASLVEAVLNEIKEEIVTGGTVKLASFGSFVVRQRSGRVGRNPKTGQEFPIPPHQVLSFKPSPVLKDKINRR